MTNPRGKRGIIDILVPSKEYPFYSPNQLKLGTTNEGKGFTLESPGSLLNPFDYRKAFKKSPKGTPRGPISKNEKKEDFYSLDHSQNQNLPLKSNYQLCPIKDCEKSYKEVRGVCL